MMPEFFSQNWCSLNWTDWIPLDAPPEIIRQVPASAGVYRVRPRDRNQLAYIGQTRMGLRARLRMLLGAYNEAMPYNDPHTAAPCLWAYRVAEGMEFDYSAASVELSDQERQVLEDMLLWNYRLEYGESTLGNHGRFHPHYSRPSNRKSGRPGAPLMPGEINPAGGLCAAPLELHGQPPDSDWMGLSWSVLRPLCGNNLLDVPGQGGLYKILDAYTVQLLYIGETSHLFNRLRSHSLKSWAPYNPVVSFHLLPADTLEYQRHEMEADLIGAYYARFSKPPVFQYLRR